MRVSFNEKLAGEECPIGTLLTLNSCEVAELMSNAGYDWLFIDLEHSALSIRDAQQLVQVTNPSCSTIVRVPDGETVWIKRILDTGCDGIMVPQINSAEDAKKAVAASKYPPLGARSVGIGRAHGYGASFADYVESANQVTSLILQIEHIDGVRNIDDILSVQGIDGVLIGPYDLSGSMDILGDVGHPDVQGAIATVKESCINAGIPCGIFVMNPEDVKKQVESGCSFVAMGIDTAVLRSTATERLKVAKDSIGDNERKSQ